MSRGRRDWLGRPAWPIRARWRDRGAASSTTASIAAARGQGSPPLPDGAAAAAGRPGPDQAREVRAGALFSQAVQRDPLSEQELVAIADRLRRRPKRPRATPRRLVVRLAASLSFLVVGGALAATATRYFDLPNPFARPPSRSSASPQRSGTRAHLGQGGQARHEPGAGTQEPQQAQLPIDVQPTPPAVDRSNDGRAPGRRLSALDRPLEPPQAPRPAPSRLPEPSPSAPSRSASPRFEPQRLDLPEPAPPSKPSSSPSSSPSAEASRVSSFPSVSRPARTPLAEESALIMSALTALRRQGDAAQALALLDRHDRSFPRGDLADEATLARVEALVKMKRSAEALALLEEGGEVHPGAGPAGPAGPAGKRKLTLTRAELRAAAGRCTAALDDLDRLLQGAPPADVVTERALWGRAACRASEGQAERARGDLEAYVRLFPSGQFTRAARAALGSGPDSPGSGP